MTNGRPVRGILVQPLEVAGRHAAPVAVEAFDRTRLQVLREIAESTSNARSEWSGDPRTRETFTYADAVRDVLAWIAGEEPTAELSTLLDL